MSSRLTKTTCALATLLAVALAQPGPAAADPGRGWGGPRVEGRYAPGWRGGPRYAPRYGRDWRGARDYGPPARGWRAAAPHWHGRGWSPGYRGPGYGGPRPWHRRPSAPPPPPPPHGTGISVILNGTW